MSDVRGKVLLVHHDKGSPHDDRITNLLTARDVPFQHLYPCAGDDLPTSGEEFSIGILYGGAQNTDEIDKYPYMADEHRWVELCLKTEKPFLGLCLGAQSLAHVLGAKVGPQDPEFYEFGFYPVWRTEAGRNILPEELFVVQAHYHGFDMPAGAEKLAFGENYPNQAMRYGDRAYGFQFHPEVTPPMFKRWQDSDWAPYERIGVQRREEQDADLGKFEPTMASWFDGFLDRFFETSLEAAA